MVRHHRRFALRDVTLGGVPIGGATIDAWEDDDGRERWAARAVMPTRWDGDEGVLAGTMGGGIRVEGAVRITDGRLRSSSSARTALVSLHGTGPLLDGAGERLAG